MVQCLSRWCRVFSLYRRRNISLPYLIKKPSKKWTNTQQFLNFFSKYKRFSYAVNMFNVMISIVVLALVIYLFIFTRFIYSKRNHKSFEKDLQHPQILRKNIYSYTTLLWTWEGHGSYLKHIESSERTYLCKTYTFYLPTYTPENPVTCTHTVIHQRIKCRVSGVMARIESDWKHSTE